MKFLKWLQSKFKKRHLVILVGLPGSGKTTYALNRYSDYIRISQDDQNGSRKLMENSFEQALKSDKNIIIDRVNFNPRQRKYFLDKASGFKKTAIYIDVEVEDCIIRASNRKDHPTMKDLSNESIQNIILQFDNMMVFPYKKEGFDEIIVIKNN